MKCRGIHLLFLTAFTSFAIQICWNKNIEDKLICITRDQKGCRCTSVKCRNIAQCTVDNVTDVQKYIHNPRAVMKLDISKNGIEFVPPKSFHNLSHLRHLSLASNRIRTIHKDAFYGLTELVELNLFDNNLIVWDTGSINKDLPNLKVLNLQWNFHFVPGENLLSLPYLETVHILLRLYDLKAYDHEYFLECTLSRNGSQLILKPPRAKLRSSATTFMGFNCRGIHLQITNESFHNSATNHHFNILCAIVKYSSFRAEKFNNEHDITKRWYIAKGVENQCWTTAKNIFIFTLLIGIVGMVLNITVVIISIRSRVLRDSVAHVLVANMAMGDLFISLYLIILTMTRQILSAEKFYNIYLPYYCRIVGEIFLIGQVISPFMTFMMTLERYLAIVYCMKPHIRIFIKQCLAAMVLGWSLTIIGSTCFMVSQIFSMGTTPICIPTENMDGVNVLTYFGALIAFLYVLCVVLYCHIYIDVKRTTEKTEQLQRDSQLARRIALVIFSNILFGIIPLVATGVVRHVSISADGISNSFKLIFWETFHITSFGLNSCLNPLLFSFRNQTFCIEFRKQLHLNQSNGVGNVPQ